ncbi:MAG TPA: hypothetical protein VNO50_08200 [Pyrinomonadaceae bacterium]|nr:hypothetical protein [Pyrinomonadaceae bacterium]
MKATSRKRKLLTLCGVLLTISMHASSPVVAQSRTKTKTNWQGHWNWAIYAKDKTELPPAYRDTDDVREIPAYALDLTLRQRGNRLSGSWGLLARFLARIDEGDIAATIKGNRATIRLTSNFGGSATIALTLRGDRLSWKLISSRGENFFPRSEVLRRMRPGEKLPYVADDETEAPD